MSTACQLDQTGSPLWLLLGRRIIGQPDIAHRVGEGEQIIGSRFRLLLDGESDHFPPARRRQGLRMLLAQVIAMWLGLAGERTEDRCGVSVGIRQRRGSGTLAACSGTAARPHLPDATPGGGSIVGSTAVSGSRRRPEPGWRAAALYERANVRERGVRSNQTRLQFERAQPPS
jgi:hypothetical protein